MTLWTPPNGADLDVWTPSKMSINPVYTSPRYSKTKERLAHDGIYKSNLPTLRHATAYNNETGRTHRLWGRDIRSIEDARYTWIERCRNEQTWTIVFPTDCPYDLLNPDI